MKMWMVVRMVMMTVVMTASRDFGGHEMEVSVTYARLGNSCFSKAANIDGVALENGDFKAILMVEMDVQG